MFGSYRQLYCPGLSSGVVGTRPSRLKVVGERKLSSLIIIIIIIIIIVLAISSSAGLQTAY
jgi:hypothetical protein